MVVVLGIYLAPGRARFLIIGSGALSVLLSQSRGATFALLIALAIALTRGARPGNHGRGRIAGALMVVVVLGIGLGGVLIAAGIFDAAVFVGLYLGLAAALGGGDDPGLTGRINLWGAALDLVESRPFGTLGPPEFILGAAVDNGWVRAFVQGGIPFAAALGLMMLPGFTRPLSTAVDGERLRTLSILLALTAISQTPLSYPPALLYWFVVGAVLAQHHAQRQTAAKEEYRPARAIPIERARVPGVGRP
jgi:O-antigen ligase